MTTVDDRVEAIVEKTVQKTLLAFGIDVSHPEGVVNFQQDMHYLRANRLRDKGIQNNTVQHGVLVIMSGLLAAAVLGAAKALGLPQ